MMFLLFVIAVEAAAMVTVVFEGPAGFGFLALWIVGVCACLGVLCCRGYFSSQSIHDPILRDEPSIVRWMIAKGELARPANARVSLNETDNLEMMRLLIDGGVDVNERGSSSHSPLLKAVRKDDLRKARLLVEHGADVNYEGNIHLGTIIFSAVSVQMVKLLVEAGADLTRRRRDISIVEVAAAHQDVAIVEYLIQAARDKGTPFTRAFLHLASPANARLLVAQLDSDVDAVYPNGCAALNIASVQGNTNLIRFLVVCGATVDAEFPVRVSDGTLVPYTAIDVCKSNEAAALLLAAGAQKGRCQFDPSVEEIADARRRIARDRVDLIRARAFEICVALEALELPALLMCEILEFACAPFASCVPFHHKWNIVVAVKHREPLAQWSSARSRSSSTSTSRDECIIDVVGESSAALR
jgi:hypothetical protein